MVSLIRVLAHLDNSEESEAFHSEHTIDLCIDLECHSTARLLQNLELVLKHGILLQRVRIVDSSIQDGPLSTCGGTLKVPVSENMSV